MSIIDKLFKVAQEEVKLPYAWGVLYSKPNSDGSKKACGNCYSWNKDNTCSIMKQNVPVKSTMVCGYHIAGTPADAYKAFTITDFVDPELAGLEEVGEGTSCETCKFYKDKLCYGVQTEDGKPQPVEPLGCCARWESI